MTDASTSTNGSPAPKGKTPLNTSGKNTSGVVIPDEAQKKHPELVQLILKSESMNTEEQNYWLQVLPVMTSDQIAELRDILETEKKKLAVIDQKYAAQKSGIMGRQAPELSEEELKAAEAKRHERQAQRRSEEEKHKQADEQTAEDLLSQLDNL
jgi:chromatin segregation and condensation protein Rec8/ScpA/Scc1 (kleisin family)